MDLSELERLEQAQHEVKRTLKLSAAMRIGAAMRPQIFGLTINSHGTCAVGAAIEGGYKGDITDWIMMEIVTRNDDYRHTREQIADWLKSIGY